MTVLNGCHREYQNLVPGQNEYLTTSDLGLDCRSRYITNLLQTKIIQILCLL